MSKELDNQLGVFHIEDPHIEIKTVTENVFMCPLDVSIRGHVPSITVGYEERNEATHKEEIIERSGVGICIP